MAKPNSDHQHQQNPLSTSCSPGHTTFVQADASNFRALVQKLTGATENSQEKLLPITLPSKFSGKTIPNAEVGPRRSAFKLQERRQSMRKLEIKLGLTRNVGRFKGEMLVSSPNCCSSVDSPVTPLLFDPFENGGFYSPGSPSEERAIAEKGFYLHPSPLNTPRNGEPELLPLFPLHSPKQSGSGS